MRIRAGQYITMLVGMGVEVGVKLKQPLALWSIKVIWDTEKLCSRSIPYEVVVLSVRKAAEGPTYGIDYADTPDGTISTHYLFPAKPKIIKLKDDYGVFHDWVCDTGKKGR